ncbi:hypothetical protein D3C81_1283270 [compost metagenome]
MRGRQAAPVGLSRFAEQLRRNHSRLLQYILLEQLRHGLLDERHERRIRLDRTDAGHGLHLAGNQQRGMAKTEQRLAVIDQTVGQLRGVTGGACLPFQVEKAREHLLGAAAHRGVHLSSGKRAVPLMPASKPLASGSVATSNRV